VKFYNEWLNSGEFDETFQETAQFKHTQASQRPLKVDLHLHTAEDPCDRVSHTARELISKAVEDGFDVLAITNHQCLTYNKRLSAYARKEEFFLSRGWKSMFKDGMFSF